MFVLVWFNLCWAGLILIRFKIGVMNLVLKLNLNLVRFAIDLTLVLFYLDVDSVLSLNLNFVRFDVEFDLDLSWIDSFCVGLMIVMIRIGLILVWICLYVGLVWCWCFFHFWFCFGLTLILCCVWCWFDFLVRLYVICIGFK